MKWLPNALTILRCILAVVVLGALAGKPAHGNAAFLAFALGAITDFSDGWLARQLGAHSRFGVWLDPIADKLLVGAALVGLSISMANIVIYVPAGIIIGRDIFMTWLRTRPVGRAVVAPSNLAKWKTACEMGAILGLLFLLSAYDRLLGTGFLQSLFLAASIVALWLAAALSAYTAWQYIRALR
jgi:CDP-diacylglycerol--glycerol-3-phosphate 3-phosphatidyltransferase